MTVDDKRLDDFKTDMLVCQQRQAKAWSEHVNEHRRTEDIQRQNRYFLWGVMLIGLAGLCVDIFVG